MQGKPQRTTKEAERQPERVDRKRRAWYNAERRGKHKLKRESGGDEATGWKRKPNLLKKFTISGGNDEGVPPVPIPNTAVKPFSADGTWLETARESRSLPESIFLSSSMAEHSAVNRVVVGSSPTWGAT